jgi:hypothetical protein
MFGSLDSILYSINHKNPLGERNMILSTDVYNTFLECSRKFPHRNPNGETTDNYRREAMKKAVATIRARHGGNYTTKTEHNTPDLWSAQSADALCYVPGAPIHGKRMDMYIWDLVNGTTFEPQYTAESEDLRPAYVLIPETKDWLASIPPNPIPPPVPPPPDEPEPDESELITRIADAILEQMIPVVLAAVNELHKELDKFREEMDSLTFEAKNRILGTITFTRKK